MIRQSCAALAIAMTILLAAPLSAAAEDAAKEKPTKVAVDGAYVKTGGNTDVTSISGGDKLAHTNGSWVFTQEARAVWGETDGVETAGRYSASLRSDFHVAPRLSVYGLGSWRRDVFAGISRQFDEGLGLSWHAVAAKQDEVDLEGGAGLLQRLDTQHVQDDFSTGRAGARYKHSFTEKSYFEGRGSYVLNLQDSQDSQGDGSMAIVAPISGGLSMKLGYDVNYRNRPLPGLEKTDTTFSAGIQFSN
jgi:putative salt-induced outer membrane protein YdiY